MKTFYDDAAVKLAMGMLDWRKKEVALYKYRGENDLAREVAEYAIVASALGTDPEKKYDKLHSAMREIFERFLEFLARFEGFLATGVVEQTDLNPYLDYWVKLIAGQDAHSPEVTEMVLPSLWKFIDYYGYRDVRRFISRYEKVAFPELKKPRHAPITRPSRVSTPIPGAPVHELCTNGAQNEPKRAKTKWLTCLILLGFVVLACTVCMPKLRS